MSQTVVNSAPAIATPGDLADFFTASDGDIVSAVNSESSASIVVGTMVKLGTAAGTVLKLTSDENTPFGIVTRAHAYADSQLESLEVDTDVFYDALTADTMMGIGRTGRYAVLIEEDVDFDDPVRVRAVATTGEVAGAFLTSDGGADTIDVSAFCRFCGDYDVDDDTGFGVAIVEINMGLASLSVGDS
jgi:hypothetical protein